MEPHHDIEYVDEVPRFWFSRRWRLAVFSCIALLIATSHRTCLDVALVSMLNHTLLATGPPAGIPITSTTQTIAPPSRAPVAVTPRHSALRLPSIEGQSRGAASNSSRSTSTGNRRNVTSSTAFAREHVTVATASSFVHDATTSSSANYRQAACRNLSDVEFFTTTVFTYQEEGDLEWSNVQTDGVLDSYYWADMLVRFPAGLLCQRYGGKRILGFALLLGSLCTVLVPLTSRVHFSLVIVLRFVTGCTVGAVSPAVSYLLGRWAPVEERSFLFSIANTGSYVCGSIIVLPMAGMLCQYGFDGGWPSVFYIFGGLGMLWFILWMVLTADCPTQDGGISHDEKEYIAGCLVVQAEGYNASQDILFPWTVAFTSIPVLVLALCQLSHEVCVYVLVRFIPIYFRHSLQLDIKQNTVCAMLPGFAFWCLMLASAGAADRLQTYGVLTTNTTRKLMNTIGAVLTAAMIASFCALAGDCSIHWLGPVSMLVVGLASCGVQLGSGSLVAHIDLASRHAAVISGLTGTVGAIAYFAVPSLTRLLIADSQDVLAMTSPRLTPTAPPIIPATDGEWRLLFVITACGHVISALAFLLFGSTSGHHHQLHAIDHGSDVRSPLTQAVPVPVGDLHYATSPEDGAVLEHQISPADDDDDDNDEDENDDIEAAMMTSQTTVDDPRWRLQSGSYYHSVSSPTSGAPTFFSSANNSETESVNHGIGDEMDDFAGVAVVGDRKRSSNRDQVIGVTVTDRSVSGKQQRNGLTDRHRKYPADGVVIGIHRLSESVL